MMEFGERGIMVRSNGQTDALLMKPYDGSTGSGGNWLDGWYFGQLPPVVGS